MTVILPKEGTTAASLARRLTAADFAAAAATVVWVGVPGRYSHRSTRESAALGAAMTYRELLRRVSNRLLGLPIDWTVGLGPVALALRSVMRGYDICTEVIQNEGVILG